MRSNVLDLLEMLKRVRCLVIALKERVYVLTGPSLYIADLLHNHKLYSLDSETYLAVNVIRR